MRISGQLLVATTLLLIPTLSYAADVALGGLSRASGYSSDSRVYRIRGAYQDSGWAYEVPVYHNCRVRIIQTPRGIDRMRQCQNLATVYR
jgi:hypothetical protein